MDVYGLIGNPVGHSLSPPMHEAAYEAMGMDARYVTLEPSEPRLAQAIEGAEVLGMAGLNVTVPFKEAVMTSVSLTELAENIGAVNTIEFTDAGPVGYNTDAVGARRALQSHDVVIDGITAVVLGAGGAARAIAWMLTNADADVQIANRTVDRAVALADEIGGTGHALADVDDLLEEIDLVVNATTVGMNEDRSPVPATALHADLTVFDAVYQPVETRLLQDAAAVGATTVDGAAMLLYQGVAAFELWTGDSAPIQAMRAALQDRL